MDLKSQIEAFLNTTESKMPYSSIRSQPFWKEVKERTSYLDAKAPTRCRIWHIENDTSEIPKCVMCERTVKWMEGKYNACCSTKCHVHNTLERRMETNRQKYGGNSPASSKTILGKMAATTLERHGVTNISKSEKTKAQKIQKSLDRYGVDNVSKAPEVQQKISDFWRGLSADEMHDIMEKQKKTAKEGFRMYQFADGREVRIQGYEDWALDALLENNQSQDIRVGKGEVPTFRFLDHHGKDRRHFPDIFLPERNLIIEVKSTFTYSKYRELNLCKQNAAIELGYLYEFWVYDVKGNLTIDPDGDCKVILTDVPKKRRKKMKDSGDENGAG